MHAAALRTVPPAHSARWWHAEGDRVRCDLCPRACLLAPGQRGWCYVRVASEEGMSLQVYGRATGLSVIRVEEAPLFHFRPGAGALVLGTPGCNMGCRHCLWWSIEQSKATDRRMVTAPPEKVVHAATAVGASVLALACNDPVVYAEYALDLAAAVREVGMSPVAVSAGFVSPAAREEILPQFDAVCIELKSLSPEFYKRLCLADLAPVLDTIEAVAASPRTWLELATPLISGVNDTDDDVKALVDWIGDHVGVEVPLHLLSNPPTHGLREAPFVSASALRRARDLALASGLRYVYTDSLFDKEPSRTYCPGCDKVVVDRDGRDLIAVHLQDGHCPACGADVAGTWA